MQVPALNWDKYSKACKPGFSVQFLYEEPLREGRCPTVLDLDLDLGTTEGLAVLSAFDLELVALVAELGLVGC